MVIIAMMMTWWWWWWRDDDDDDENNDDDNDSGSDGCILGDPGVDKGGEGKSKRVEKYVWNEEK